MPPTGLVQPAYLQGHVREADVPPTPPPLVPPVDLLGHAQEADVPTTPPPLHSTPMQGHVLEGAADKVFAKAFGVELAKDWPLSCGDNLTLSCGWVGWGAEGGGGRDWPSAAGTTCHYRAGGWGGVGGRGGRGVGLALSCRDNLPLS